MIASTSELVNRTLPVMADAEQILCKLLNKIATEKNYENPEITVNKASTDGANFTSLLFQVTISAKDKPDLELFAKVAAVNENVRSITPMKLFDVEGFFYEELLLKFQKLEEDNNVGEKDRLIVPEFYGFHPTLYEETLVLENLNKKGFMMLDRLEVLSWEYMSSALSQMAKFHALSMAYGEHDPEGFARDQAKVKIEWDQNKEMMEQMMGQLIEKTIAVVNEENRPRFEKFVRSSPEDLFTKFMGPGKKRTLRHGDFRASNLMHKHNEDGSITVITIDYQTVQPGDPLADLLYLVFTGTDEAFRATHWQQLLDCYYRELSAALNRLGLDPDETYSREYYEESLKEMLPYGITVALTILPLVCVEEPPKIGADLDSFMDIKPKEAYRERLNGILNDYIKWGIL